MDLTTQPIISDRIVSKMKQWARVKGGFCRIQPKWPFLLALCRMFDRVSLASWASSVTQRFCHTLCTMFVGLLRRDSPGGRVLMVANNLKIIKSNGYVQFSWSSSYVSRSHFCERCPFSTARKCIFETTVVILVDSKIMQLTIIR